MYICRKYAFAEKNLLVWLSHAFDVNNGDDSDNESGEDEEITHFVGSKNIGAAHGSTKIAWNKHTLLFGKTI